MRAPPAPPANRPSGRARRARRWLHFLFAAHIHEALNASAGMRAAHIDVGLIRTATTHACVINATVPAAQLPPIDEPMLPGMERVCGAMRGSIRCEASSLRCALHRRYEDT